MAVQERRVLIVGGGLAGLAAAAALAPRGFRVTLCESRPRLGGRAGSFLDQASGETIDNCQHVGMGCCTNLQHFCRTVGISEYFRVEKSLTFIGPDGSRTALRASSVPAPGHLAGAFAKLPYLSVKEKWLLARAVRSLARTPARQLRGISFSTWLAQHRQSVRLTERFWEVILVSALSESLDRIDAAYARKVLVDGFLANRYGWEVHVPTLPLDTLYVDHVIPWLRSRGVEVRLLAAVARLDSDGAGGIARAELRDGNRLEADDFILAVPHFRLPPLLPDDPLAPAVVETVRRLESAPITSVHLWYDRQVTDLPHAVIVGRLSQWLFAKPASQTGPSPPVKYGYQVVISASRHVQKMSREELIAAVTREMKEIFPAASGASILAERVVTEHRAVFSVVPGVDRWRPAQQSPWSNLQIAGDWTQTEWPATMEGAVRSGLMAAENVLARCGRPEQLVQPDLPPSTLARCLLGLSGGGSPWPA